MALPQRIYSYTALMFATLLKRFRHYIQTISWLLFFIETAVAVFLGALVGAAISDSKWTWWAVGVGVLYVLIFSIKFYTQRLFPASILGELEATEKLDIRDRELNRAKRIFTYLDQAVEKLNAQTCSIADPENPLYDETVEHGIRELIEPLINRPHYILACDSDTFTVAARVGHSTHPDATDEWIEYFIVFRDDLDIENSIVGNQDQLDAFSDLAATGMRFKLRNAMHSAFNHNEYNVRSFEHHDKCYTIVTAPIPLICETPDAGGVLCIITNCQFSCPVDMPDVLRIYGRLIANWLDKYSECINNQRNAEQPLPNQPEDGAV